MITMSKEASAAGIASAPPCAKRTIGRSAICRFFACWIASTSSATISPRPPGLRQRARLLGASAAELEHARAVEGQRLEHQLHFIDQRGLARVGDLHA